MRTQLLLALCLAPATVLAGKPAATPAPAPTPSRAPAIASVVAPEISSGRLADGRVAVLQGSTLYLVNPKGVQTPAADGIYIAEGGNQILVKGGSADASAHTVRRFVPPWKVGLPEVSSP